MYFKLYHNVFSSPPPEERRALFNSLYEEHGVELIGVFRNRKNPLEFYMLTAYRDEQHYHDFIAAVRDLPHYKEMTQRISDIRLAHSSVALEKV